LKFLMFFNKVSDLGNLPEGMKLEGYYVALGCKQPKAFAIVSIEKNVDDSELSAIFDSAVEIIPIVNYESYQKNGTISVQYSKF